MASFSAPLSIQPKLTVSKPDDPYEREADRVAEQVMRISDPEIIPRKTLRDKNCLIKDEEKKKKIVKVTADQSVRGEEYAPDNLLYNIGSGKPLEKESRDFMEPRFGFDFSQVKVHTDNHAARSASLMDAHAFTFGSDIVFNTGKHTSKADEGKKLLAHELTHVIQQTNGNRQKAPIIQKTSVLLQRQKECNNQENCQHIPDEKNKIDAYGGTGGSGGSSEKECGTGGNRGSGGGPPSDNTRVIPSGPPEITLETGNTSWNNVNNLVHQQVCVDRYGSGNKRCFSFAYFGLQTPQFSRTWLGWALPVVGIAIWGKIYEPSPVPRATIVARHYPTIPQAKKWLNYMLVTRRGLDDAYSIFPHNCRTYSQWEFRDAPSHW